MTVIIGESDQPLVISGDVERVRELSDARADEIIAQLDVYSAHIHDPFEFLVDVQFGEFIPVASSQRAVDEFAENCLAQIQRYQESSDPDRQTMLHAQAAAVGRTDISNGELFKRFNQPQLAFELTPLVPIIQSYPAPEEGDKMVTIKFGDWRDDQIARQPPLREVLRLGLLNEGRDGPSTSLVQYVHPASGEIIGSIPKSALIEEE